MQGRRVGRAGGGWGQERGAHAKTDNLSINDGANWASPLCVTREGLVAQDAPATAEEGSATARGFLSKDYRRTVTRVKQE